MSEPKLYPQCHSQGELLYLIEKNNLKEVCINPQIPGHLSIDALVSVLRQKYPDIQITILETRPQIVIDHRLTLCTVITVLVIQTIFTLAIQYNMLTIQQITYSSIATVSAFLFFMGGFLWFTKKQ